MAATREFDDLAPVAKLLFSATSPSKSKEMLGGASMVDLMARLDLRFWIMHAAGIRRFAASPFHRRNETFTWILALNALRLA